MKSDELPPIVARLKADYPHVWEAYNRLGESVAKAGPLEARAERLIKLAIAIGGRLEGAVRSHTRRGLQAGISAEELAHVALLAITTVGWPSAIAGLSWITDEIERSSGAA